MSSLTTKMVMPGSTIGVFGGGQLGRMFCHAAQRLGYRVIVFTDEADSPASQVANETIRGDYLNLHAVSEFAQRTDVITLEFENIHLQAVERAAEFVPVRPGHRVLQIAQNRCKEKTTLRDYGFPVTPFCEVRSYQDIPRASETLGWPMVLKTSSGGYDGKGQRKVETASQANDALDLLGPEPLIAEKWITYVAEVSVLVARSPRGQIAAFPMFTNVHRNHILDVTTFPPLTAGSDDNQGQAVDAKVERKAIEVAKGIAESLRLEGLLCVEMFVDASGEVMVNELAPRPHNSGHLTMEACSVSQFEQQVRAVCNLPLCEEFHAKPAAMVNLLGDLWGPGMDPDWNAALVEPQAHLHLYGKREARVGRKMGHLTVLGQTSEMAAARALEIRGKMDRGLVSNQSHD